MTPPVRHMLLATVFFALMSLQIKLLPRLPVWEIVFFRAAVTFVLCLSILRYKGLSPWGTNRKVLFLRGLFGTIAMCGFFTTLTNLPLATASTLQRLSPIFTVLLAAAFFSEKVGFRRWLCYGVAFAGVAMVKGFDPDIELQYFLIGIGAAFSAASAYNCIARLKSSEDPQVIMFYFPMVTLPLIAIPTYYSWLPPTPRELALLISIGVTVQTAQYFMTRSYQSGQTASVSAIGYLGIVFALFFDVTVFEKMPTWGSIAGMVVVVAAVMGSVFVRTSD